MTKNEYLSRYSQWVDTSPTNHYGERVVSSLITAVEDGGVRYRCNDNHWQAAHKVWCSVRQADRDANVPEPFPAGHCMFVRPMDYSCVRLGEDNPAAIRRAMRHRVLANLDGWDRELRQSWEGMRKLAKIVRATVDAKLSGASLGGAPYMACIMANA